jgi:glycosyltransferase involved in cell wall biosynthesis
MNNFPSPPAHDAAGDSAAVLVSVIIPSYNAAATIERAIDSVLAQTMTALEIIVIDDGSVDCTVALIDGLIAAGAPIRLIRMSKNGGVSAARNAGISVARGRYLAFLDADDTWMPEKLEKQLAAIERDLAITLVSCNSRLVSPEGQPLKEGHVNRPPVQGADAWKTLLVYNFMPTPTVFTYTSLVKEIGGFDETLKVGEDLDLWIRIGLRGKIAVLPEIYTNYYDLADSLMKRHSQRSGDIVVPMLERHIERAALDGKLNRQEIRHMRGLRAFQMGCNLFFEGNHLASIPIFVQAISNGVRPLKSLTYIPRALWGHLRAARPPTAAHSESDGR